ncbi:MAG: hypothetical protein ACYSUI_12355 [Planctomycetota bacterium]
MCLTLLQDSRLYRFLFIIDQGFADEAHAEGCGCGGRLHRANYARKPRGGPADLGPEYGKRLSWCCAREGCRSRKTPPSVRFLGRRVYLGAVVLLVSAMQGGITEKRADRLQALLGMSRRTLWRWRSWWRQSFPASDFWKRERGRFMPRLDVGSLPASLLERFTGEDERSSLVQALSFLAPLTTQSC